MHIRRKEQRISAKTTAQIMAAGIFLLWLAGVALFQKFALGQNYFVVSVNNKVVGNVSSRMELEEVMHKSRRQLAAQTDGYLMQEIKYEAEKTKKPFVSLMSEEQLTEAVCGTLKEEESGVSAYTVCAGGNQISFASLAQVEEFLDGIKAPMDMQNEFTVVLDKETDHQEGSLTASIRKQEEETAEQAYADAGITEVLGQVLQESLEKPEERRYESGILEMNYTEPVILFTDRVDKEHLSTVSSAVEEVTKEKETNKIYEIQPGDCLSVIAQENETTVDSIVALNGFASADVGIYAGEELILSVPQPDIALRISEGVVYEEDYNAAPQIIPNDAWYTSYEVVREEGMTGHREVNNVITYENGIETERTMIHQRVITAAVPAVIERGTTIPPTYIKPLAGGRVSSLFGRRWGKMHKGIDWACPSGTMVYASSDGVAVSAAYVSGYGNCVLLSHPDGRMTRYAHNSKLLVKAGQSVSQGEPIALSGSTGHSTGPHVHFEILINGSQVNPMKYLN